MSPRSIRALTALSLLAALACGEDRVIKANPPGFRQDVFQQEAASRIDTLWVIDNSASMEPHQAELAASLTRFMQLFDRGLVDYRIAVTTTDVIRDKGELIGNPPIVTPTLADPVAAFQRNVRVGTGGKGHEQAFEAARIAIEREKARANEALAERAACLIVCPAASQSCRRDCERRYAPEFMRPEAHLYLVFVSDEEEQSFGEVRYFQRLFEGALGVGNEDAVSVATICGDVPAPACEAEPGTRYVALAQATGGLVASICDATFERHLERLALDAAGLKRKFTLSRPPDPETLALEIHYRCDTGPEQMSRCETETRACDGMPPEHPGIVCVPPMGEPNGWTYEPSTNGLLFHGDAVPGLRSALVASYQEDEKAAAR